MMVLIVMLYRSSDPFPCHGDSSRVVFDFPRKICREKEGDCGRALDSLTCCSSKEMVFTAARDHSSVA